MMVEISKVEFPRYKGLRELNPVYNVLAGPDTVKENS